MRRKVSWMTALALASFLPMQAAGAGIVAAQMQTATVITTGQSSYGAVLFTGSGQALYMLSYDTVGSAGTPAVSSCTGKCLGAWPPLLATAANDVAASGGVVQSGLGTIARTDANGKTVNQVTYFGHPLYTFTADKAAGDTNGENVAAFNGRWNLVTPAGRPDAGVATVTIESSPEGAVLSTPTAFGTSRSLYNLTSDFPNLPTCFGGCTRIWPPLLTTAAPLAGTGVDPAGLGTVMRPDGTRQVTYFGVPLYLFAFDLGPGAKSGETNGEDFIDPFNHGIWYLVNATSQTVPGPATVSSKSTNFGTILMDGTFPLYAFSSDTGTSSTCTGECARIWTPFLTNSAPQAAAGSSVDSASLGTIKRADGTLQVTYRGHRLYLFAPDFSGTGGQRLSAYGGVFSLLQSSGALSETATTTRNVVAMPNVTATTSGRAGSFVVAYTSKAAGQGEVYFGPGPGCGALVEVAMGDAGAGTTTHEVTVTGNDLPGTIGNIGVQPGATYSFEVVTFTPAGTETDDNQDKCFTVTIPAS